jgi:hypothetical protein
MFDWWNHLSLTIGDALLGWLLIVPRELTLIGVAVVTASLLTISRWWTTDQNRLRRAAEDLRQLKRLRREARRRGDRGTVARCQAVKARINLIKLRAEGKPLLAVIVPLALLATWAFYRLEFHPPRPGETVEVVAYLPISAEGDLIHLVPRPGLKAETGWVQPFYKVTPPASPWERSWAWITRQPVQPPPPDAVAVWRLSGAANRYPLIFRYRDKTLQRELFVGYRIYAPAWDVRDGEPLITEIRQREVRLFGLPGLGAWLPAWLVGYLVLTIPFVFLLKRLLMVY